jgi:hypothetical protein
MSPVETFRALIPALKNTNTRRAVAPNKILAHIDNILSHDPAFAKVVNTHNTYDIIQRWTLSEYLEHRNAYPKLDVGYSDPAYISEWLLEGSLDANLARKYFGTDGWKQFADSITQELKKMVAQGGWPRGDVVLNSFFGGENKVSSHSMYVGNVSGQVGAIGVHSSNTGNTFNQQREHVCSDIDFATLAKELNTLRTELRKMATETAHDQAVVSVGQAVVAAGKKDGAAVLQHLKDAGKWSLEIASKIGTNVAIKAIESAINIK